jgi:hypothetical protein
MGQDYTVPQVVDIHRQLEFRCPARKRSGAVIDQHYFGLKSLAPVVDDIHGGLRGEGAGGGHT